MKKRKRTNSMFQYRKGNLLNLGLITHLHPPQAGCARAVQYYGEWEITKQWLQKRRKIDQVATKK